jgi:hypothetical protein
VLLAAELMMVLVLLITYTHLRRRVYQSDLEYKRNPLLTPPASVTDYTVFVYNLPSDVREKELAHHFSSLYALDGEDW